MRTIGLLGGMSWESTVTYYQLINRAVAESLGGLHSAELFLCSVDFHAIERLQRERRWDEAGDLLADAARRLEGAGADFLVLCTNTMHKIAPAIEAAVSVPLLHIADAVGERISETRVTRVGLLGTRFTMEEAFYRERLEGRHGLEVMVPEARDRAIVDRVIFEELCLGELNDRSRDEYRRIVAGLAARGCRGVIFGCTEIGLLLAPADAPVPVFDSTAIHARRAAAFALSDAPALDTLKS